MIRFGRGLAPLALLFVCASASALTMAPVVTPSGELKLVDPSQPLSGTNPVTVDTGLSAADVDGAHTLIAGSVSGTTVSNVRLPYLVYTKGGQVRRVNMTVGASNVPVRVSSIADACQLENQVEDFTNINLSRIRVSRRGADAACNTNDDTRTVVRLTASATTDAPVVTGLKWIQGIYSTSGALVGFLTIEGATRSLRHRDINFANPVVMFGLTSASYWREEIVLLRHIYLRATRTGQTQPGLYRYDQAGNGTTTSVSLHTFTEQPTTPSYEFAAAYDSEYLYFGDANQVFRTPLDATSAAQTVLLATAPAGQNITEISAPANSGSIVFSATGSSLFTGGVYAAPKLSNNVNAIALRTNSLSQGKVATLVAASANLVYINYANYLNSTIVAVRINPDGTGAVNAANSFWAGSMLPSTIDFVASGPGDSPNLVLRVTKGAGSDEVRLINAADGASRKIMGTIANPVSMQSSFGFGIGRYGAMGAAISRGGDVSDMDVFMFDVGVLNSLRAVSATVGGDDYSLGFK